MPITTANNPPARTGWCQICGGYQASPVDVVELRVLLERNGTPNPDAPGQAHPGCMARLREANPD